jgi:Transposase DDE domain
MTPLQEDWQVLMDLFPTNWRELAKETGSIVRLRHFKSVEDVLRTLLLHVGRGWGLRETAVYAKMAGIAEVSDVTLLNRLRDAEPWLRRLCEQLFKDNGVGLEPALKGCPVRVVDATTVKEPGKTGSQWRIHYSLRLPTLECDYFELTSARGKNTGERLGRFEVHAGEVILADAGYSHPPGIASIVSQHADVCVRLNPASVPLLDEQGQPFPLLDRLKSLRRTRQIADWPVQILCGTESVPARLCVVRKSQVEIRRAQRRITRKQQQQKTSGARATRRYACYVMVLTTLPQSIASSQTVLECYRLRWQIELTFKRLKSIAQFGHVPKTSDSSSRAWLYAKLFVALLTQKLARIGSTFSPWGYYLQTQAPHS